MLKAGKKVDLLAERWVYLKDFQSVALWVVAKESMKDRMKVGCLVNLTAEPSAELMEHW